MRMNRKFWIVWIVMILFSALIVGAMMLSIANRQLPSGSWADFAALTDQIRAGELRDPEERSWSAADFYTWKASFPDWTGENPDFGGAFCLDEDGALRMYVKNADQALRDSLQLQEDGRKRSYEVVLCPCAYSLTELREARDALDAWLATAPASVRDSVQLNVVMPRQNRVAVWVVDWSAADQLKLAQAMGSLSSRFFLIKEDLDKVLPQMEFVFCEDWVDRISQTVGEDPIPYADYKTWVAQLRRDAYELYANELAMDGTPTWRTAGLTLGYYYGTLADHNRVQSNFYITSYQRAYTGTKVFQDPPTRTRDWTDEESYAYYDEFGTQQERIFRAAFRDAAECPYGILVRYGG